MEIPFIGGAYEGRSSNSSPQVCYNLYKETGNGYDTLVGVYGASAFNSSYSGEVRGGIAYNSKAYFVIGNTLYEFNSAGTGTSMGTLSTSNGRVSMAHNGTRSGSNQQIMILDGTTGYIYDNTTSSLSSITDADMVASSLSRFIDGYFVFPQDDSDRFWITNLYDGTTVDSTDFFTAEGDPDKIVSILVDQRQVFVFGEDTLELWYNSGDADQTFQRFQGGHIQVGCAAAHTPARFDNSVVWLSRNERGHGQVVRFEGGQPIVISSPEVNYQISQYSTISDAFAYAYQDEGHEFYVLTFPTENETWVFDGKEKEWHRRGHTIGDENVNRERYNCHVFAFGKHLFGDYANGKIYELDHSLFTLDGDRILKERKSPAIGEQKRQRLAELELKMEVGIGSVANDNDSLVWMSWSKDGGHTFTNEISRDVGNLGDYNKRIVWRRLGQARDWVFRMRTWTPNKLVIENLFARVWGEPYGEQS